MHETNLSTLLDIHLFTKDVHIRKLNLLARLDVIVCYQTISHHLQQLEKKKSAAVTHAEQSSSAVTAYDNFEQFDNVKSQRLDDATTFYSVITAELVDGVEISADGLQQNMLENAQLTLDQVL